MLRNNTKLFVPFATLPPQMGIYCGIVYVRLYSRFRISSINCLLVSLTRDF